MFEIIALVIRTLVPFLKESVLQGLTPKEWLKRNKTGVVWLGVVLTLVFSVLHLSSLVFKQSAAIHEMTQASNKMQLSVQMLTMQRDQAEKDKLAAEKLHRELTEQHQSVLEEAAGLEEKVEKYERRLSNCGIDLNYQGNGTPSCPVRRVVVRQKAKEPPPLVLPAIPPEKPKPTLRERFKAFFGVGKKDDEK